MQVDREEFLRYLGWKGQETDDTVSEKLDRAAERALELSRPRSVVRRFGLDGMRLEGTDFFFEGEDIRKHLSGCGAVFLLAATLGAQPERELMRLSEKSACEALLFDTACSCAVECYCDEICEDLQRDCPTALTARFSCGYGDFPLGAQREICRLLRTDTQIGLCCDESLLLTPRKSVTAVVGITARPAPANAREGCGCGKQSHSQCGGCGKTDCAFRREPRGKESDR